MNQPAFIDKKELCSGCLWFTRLFECLIEQDLHYQTSNLVFHTLTSFDQFKSMTSKSMKLLIYDVMKCWFFFSVSFSQQLTFVCPNHSGYNYPYAVVSNGSKLSWKVWMTTQTTPQSGGSWRGKTREEDARRDSVPSSPAAGAWAGNALKRIFVQVEEAFESRRWKPRLRACARGWSSWRGWWRGKVMVGMAVFSPPSVGLKAQPWDQCQSTTRWENISFERESKSIDATVVLSGE